MHDTAGGLGTLPTSLLLLLRYAEHRKAAAHAHRFVLPPFLPSFLPGLAAFSQSGRKLEAAVIAERADVRTDASGRMHEDYGQGDLQYGFKRNAMIQTMPLSVSGLLEDKEQNVQLVMLLCYLLSLTNLENNL